MVWSSRALTRNDGVLTAKEFLDQLLDSNQIIKCSGAGAAHQNGVAERNAQTVVNMARTVMLHAAIHSPEGAISAHLWPMAVDHAIWIHNRIPRQDTGLAPIKAWSRSMLMNPSDTLANCHVWGCPTHVLEPKLPKVRHQNTQMATQEQERSSLGLLTPSLGPHCFGFEFGHAVNHTPVPCGV